MYPISHGEHYREGTNSLRNNAIGYYCINAMLFCYDIHIIYNL